MVLLWWKDFMAKRKEKNTVKPVIINKYQRKLHVIANANTYESTK